MEVITREVVFCRCEYRSPSVDGLRLNFYIVIRDRNNYYLHGFAPGATEAGFGTTQWKLGPNVLRSTFPVPWGGLAVSFAMRAGASQNSHYQVDLAVAGRSQQMQSNCTNWLVAVAPPNSARIRGSARNIELTPELLEFCRNVISFPVQP